MPVEDVSGKLTLIRVEKSCLNRTNLCVSLLRWRCTKEQQVATATAPRINRPAPSA